MSNTLDVVETSVVHRSNDVYATINQYHILCVLGEGMHGKVMLARNKTSGERVAIKAMRRIDPHNRRLPRSNRLGPTLTAQQETESKIRREIAVMKKCSHRNLVRLLEVIDDPSSKKIYLVMENLAGGEVLWRTKDGGPFPVLTLDQTRCIMRDVTLGLEYLHHQGIIHRDIKPANLLWTADRKSVKICDFGVSHFSLATVQDGARYDEVGLSKTAGSPAFFAPEVCDWEVDDPDLPGSSRARPRKRGQVTKKIDIWALGVTFYCLLFGTPPWQGVNEWVMYRSICTEDFVVPDKMAREQIPTGGRDRRPEGREIGWVVVDLLSGLLEKDQNKRITLAQIKRIPWIHTDVRDPERWLRETALESQTRVTVTDQDTQNAIHHVWYSNMRLKNIRNKIRNSFPKFSRRPAQENASAGSSTTNASAGPSTTNASAGPSTTNVSACPGKANGASSSRKPSMMEGKFRLLGIGSTSPSRANTIPKEHRRRNDSKAQTRSDPAPRDRCSSRNPRSTESISTSFSPPRHSDSLPPPTAPAGARTFFFGATTSSSHSPATSPTTPPEDTQSRFHKHFSALLRQRSPKVVHRSAVRSAGNDDDAPRVRTSAETLDVMRSSTEESSGLSSSQRAASWACSGSGGVGGEDDEVSSETDPTRSVVDFGAGGYIDQAPSVAVAGMTHSDSSSNSTATNSTPHPLSASLSGERQYPSRVRSPLAHTEQQQLLYDSEEETLSSDTSAEFSPVRDPDSSDEDVLELRIRRPSSMGLSHSPHRSPLPREV